MQYAIKEGTRGLIFDLDGTLADTMPYHLQAWQETCQELSMKMSSEFLKSYMGMPGWIIAEEIIKENNMAGKVDPNKLFDAKKLKYQILRHKVTVLKPVEDVVKRYRGSIKMAVGTGGYREAAERTLKQIGMEDYFEIIVTADDVKNHKPCPDTFLKCAELMNLDPSTIEVLEDGDLGIEAAIRAGMHPVDVRPWLPEW